MIASFLFLLIAFTVNYFQIHGLPVSNRYKILLFISTWVWKLGLAIIATYLFTTTYAASDMLPMFLDAKKIGCSFTNWWQTGIHLIDYDRTFFINQNLNYGHEFRALFFSWLIALPLMAGIESLLQLNLLLSAIFVLVCFAAALKLFRNHNFPFVIIIVPLLFIPGIAIWHSAMFKECIAFLLVLCIYYSIPTHPFSGNISTIFRYGISFLFLIILFYLKYYYALLIFMLIAISYILILYRLNFFKFLIAIITIILISGTLHPNLHFTNILEAIRINHLAMIERVGNNSRINFNDIHNPIFFYINNIPLVITLFFANPFMQGISNLFQLIIIPEKLLFLILFLFLIFKKSFWTNVKDDHSSIYFFFWSFVSSCLLAYSSPNAGALLRYQSFVMPFAWIVLLYHASLNWPFIGKILSNKAPIDKK